MLLGLRVTPCSGTGKSPSELLMNRRLRTLLDSIHPVNKQHMRVEQQITNNAQRKHRETDIGQCVVYRNYGRGPRWLPGTVTSKDGPSSYQVTSGNGNIVSRHIDQLIPKKPSSSTTGEEESKDKVPEEEKEESIQEQVQESSQEKEQIIQIPSSEEWAEMLGIPSGAETTYQGGKLKNKVSSYARSPYARPSHRKYLV